MTLTKLNLNVNFTKDENFDNFDVVFFSAYKDKDGNLSFNKDSEDFYNANKDSIDNVLKTYNIKNIDYFSFRKDNTIFVFVIFDKFIPDDEKNSEFRYHYSRAEILFKHGAAFVPLLSKLKDDVKVLIKIPFSSAQVGLQFIQGILLKSYKFSVYLSKNNQSTRNITVFDTGGIEESFQNAKAEVEGVFLARDLVNYPSSDLTTTSYAELLKDVFKNTDVKVDVLEKEDLRKENMHLHLAVGQGSHNPPKTVILTYNGDKDSDKYQGFVGKGICFDAGGLDIKPTAAMLNMKDDMGGSASVAGVFKFLSNAKPKKNVVALLGLAENMVDSHSYRPSDIIKSKNGITVEIGNTDAEGRLVLADNISLIQQRYKLDYLIDIATLTGAMVVALGSIRTGMFSNNQKLSKKIFDIGEENYDKVWEMPIDDEYEEGLNSKIADTNNISKSGGAGSITAALFLKKFVNKTTKWAHLDIAGTEGNAKSPLKEADVLGSGSCVRLLSKLVSE